MLNSKVPIVPARSRKKLQEMANQFRQKWSQYPDRSGPVEVDYFFEIILPKQYGITTDYDDLSKYGAGLEILGFTDAAMKTSYVSSSLLDATGVAESRRFRATTGHEIGHCVVHVPYLCKFSSVARSDGVGLFRASRSDIPAYHDPEWQAWEFCDELLMPTQHLMALICKGATTADLAEEFDVNPAYIRTRLSKLKIKLP